MADDTVEGAGSGRSTWEGVEGVPQTTSPFTLDKVLGPSKRFSALSRLEWTYIGFMILSVVLLVTFTIVRMCDLTPIHDPDFAFCLVLLINSVFSIFYIFDGMRRERPSEMVLLSFALGLMVVYLAVNYSVGRRTTIKLVRLVIAGVLGPILSLVGLYFACMYQKHGELHRKVIGSDPKLQRQYTTTSFFQDLLKFDLELQWSMIILMLGSRVSMDTTEIVILAVGIPFSVGWFVLGYIAFRWQCKAYFNNSSGIPTEKDELLVNARVAVLFFVLSTPGLVYIGYKIWHLTKYIDDHPGVAGATIACLAIGVVVRVAVVLLAAILFKKGQKPKREQPESDPGLPTNTII